MPVNPAAVSGAIQAAAPDLVGPVWLQLVAALGAAVSGWAMTPGNILITGVTTGTAGSGVTNGKLFIVPQPGPVSVALASASLVGVHTPSIGRAVGVGVANAFNATALYQGTSVGVGVGSDVVSTVVANPGPLVGLIMSSGLVGVNSPSLAAALASGIAALVSTGTGTGVVTGAGGPAAAQGMSISKVV